MKNIAVILLLGSMMSCSDQIRVRSDYDAEVDLTKFKTFNWLPAKEIESKNNPLLLNELTFKRLRKAIDQQLALKQVQFSESNPALLVHYHIIVDNRTAIRPAVYGYNYGAYWMRNQVDAYQYREGTLIIDLMDASNKNLLWRGWGTSVIDGPIDLTEEQINDAVSKILKAFPPSKK
jgi:hypothetical protein